MRKGNVSSRGFFAGDGPFREKRVRGVNSSRRRRCMACFTDRTAHGLSYPSYIAFPPPWVETPRAVFCRRASRYNILSWHDTIIVVFVIVRVITFMCCRICCEYDKEGLFWGRASLFNLKHTCSFIVGAFSQAAKPWHRINSILSIAKRKRRRPHGRLMAPTVLL